MARPLQGAVGSAARSLRTCAREEAAANETAGKAPMSGNTSRSGAKFVVTRTYRATLKEVWDLWTTKEGFESWWAPAGCRADVREIDARPAGVLRYDMVAETP